jgi:hypothetical protein
MLREQAKKTSNTQPRLKTGTGRSRIRMRAAVTRSHVADSPLNSTVSMLPCSQACCG